MLFDSWAPVSRAKYECESRNPTTKKTLVEKQMVGLLVTNTPAGALMILVITLTTFYQKQISTKPPGHKVLSRNVGIIHWALDEFLC